MKNIELILQEIERRIDYERELMRNSDKKYGAHPPSCDITILALLSIRGFIDSLPKETVADCKDIGEAAEGYAKDKTTSEDLEKIDNLYGFRIGDKVRLVDGDGRPHIIKYFEKIEGLHGPDFYRVIFEDNTASDHIFPGDEYPNGYHTCMQKIDKQGEDLEKDAEYYANVIAGEEVQGLSIGGEYIPAIKELIRRAFQDGRRWQQEQFEKNRLAACDNQTKEEYERETDFATSIIEKEHRQPTFSDAINYGMRLQKEQLLKDAVEGEVVIPPGYGAYVKEKNNKALKQYLIDNYKDGDKVKIIIVKEDKQ